MNLGVLRFENKDFDGAVVHLRRAMDGADDDAATAGYLAMALAGQGKTDEAIANYRRALKAGSVLKKAGLDPATMHTELAKLLAEANNRSTPDEYRWGDRGRSTRPCAMSGSPNSSSGRESRPRRTSRAKWPNLPAAVTRKTAAEGERPQVRGCARAAMPRKDHGRLPVLSTVPIPSAFQRRAGRVRLLPRSRPESARSC